MNKDRRANVLVDTLLTPEREKVLKGECPWCGGQLVSSAGRKDCTRCLGGFPSRRDDEKRGVVEVSQSYSFIFQGLLEQDGCASIALRLQTVEDHVFTMTREQVQSNYKSFPHDAFLEALAAMDKGVANGNS